MQPQDREDGAANSPRNDSSQDKNDGGGDREPRSSFESRGQGSSDRNAAATGGQNPNPPQNERATGGGVEDRPDIIQDKPDFAAPEKASYTVAEGHEEPSSDNSAAPDWLGLADMLHKARIARLPENASTFGLRTLETLGALSEPLGVAEKTGLLILERISLALVVAEVGVRTYSHFLHDESPPGIERALGRGPIAIGHAVGDMIPGPLKTILKTKEAW